MWSPEELAKLRFAMSEIPEPDGQRGDYEEKRSQWFLDRGDPTGYRHCIRNQRTKRHL